MDILNTQAFQVYCHILGVMLALSSVLIIWRMHKGTTIHKRIGWIYIIGMVLASISSFWISSIKLIGPFSPIHLLSILVLHSIWQGVKAIRVKNVTRHKRSMYGAAIYGLGVAGAFTFMPGRLNYDLLMSLFK